MENAAVQVEKVALLIHMIRGVKVILDRDLAKLYGVETRTLKQAVRRNIERFPEDFMFELTTGEIDEVVSQNVIPGKGSFGGASPMAFTEQGVAMLSSVLRSRRAVEVNIAIMRTFVQLRTLMDGNRELARRIESLESKYDEQCILVEDARDTGPGGLLFLRFLRDLGVWGAYLNLGKGVSCERAWGEAIIGKCPFCRDSTDWSSI
jgi:hypothetical protein